MRRARLLREAALNKIVGPCSPLQNFAVRGRRDQPGWDGARRGDRRCSRDTRERESRALSERVTRASYALGSSLG